MIVIIISHNEIKFAIKTSTLVGGGGRREVWILKI